MNWFISHRADPRAVQIADRHYNRQKPGTPQFVKPGRCLVFLTRDAKALWVSSWPFARYVKHAWAGAWENSYFRRESGPLASDLIREAVAATRWEWEDLGIPPQGIVTFVDGSKVRSKSTIGYCYLKAGFVPCTPLMTAGGLYAFQMLPDMMPAPERFKRHEISLRRFTNSPSRDTLLIAGNQ